MCLGNLHMEPCSLPAMLKLQSLPVPSRVLAKQHPAPACSAAGHVRGGRLPHEHTSPCLPVVQQTACLATATSPGREPACPHLRCGGPHETSDMSPPLGLPCSFTSPRRASASPSPLQACARRSEPCPAARGEPPPRQSLSATRRSPSRGSTACSGR